MSGGPVLPAVIRREVALDHEIWWVPDRASRRARWATVRRAVAALLGGLALASIYLGVVFTGLVLVLGLGAVVLLLGLVLLRPEKWVAPRLDQVRIDELGLRVNARSVKWGDIDEVHVDPYPFVDESWVRCVWLRTGEDTIALGMGLEPEELEALAARLIALRDAADPTRERPDGPALDGLDTLVGRSRGAGDR